MGCLWCGKYSRQCKTMPSGPPEFIPPFIPVTGSYGKISSPLTEISVEKTEISVTEPARPLIWTHRKFYKGFRGEARSRKPGQPGQPGSYEEALGNITESTHDNCLVPWRIHRQNFLLKPNEDKNLWIRTISRDENWRPAWTFLQVETRTLFLCLFSSYVLLGVITLFLQTLAFYHVNDVKIHTSEQQLKDLGSHF